MSGLTQYVLGNTRKVFCLYRLKFCKLFYLSTPVAFKQRTYTHVGYRNTLLRENCSKNHNEPYNQPCLVFLIQRHNLTFMRKSSFFGRAPAIYLNNLLMFEVSYLYHYKHSFLSLDYIFEPQEVKVLDHIGLPISKDLEATRLAKLQW